MVPAFHFRQKLTLPSPDKKRVKLLLVVPFASIFVFSMLVSVPQQSAYAMGPPPGGCANSDQREYDSTFASFTISSSEQTVDVLANQGATMDVDITEGYTISLTLHALSTGTIYSAGHFEKTTFSDSELGYAWLHTDIARNFGQGYCEDGLTREGEKTLTFTGSYEWINPRYDLPDTQTVNFETTHSSANYNIRWVDNTDSVGTSQLTVDSEDMSGNPIYGYYTVLSSGGDFLDDAFTPATFQLDNGVQYEIGVYDYGDYVFDHWKATGSGFRDQSFRITSDTTMTAVYRNVNDPVDPQPEPGPEPEPGPDTTTAGQSSITVRTIDSGSNNKISGYYTILYDNGGAVLDTGFSPATFDVTSGQTYTVEVQDYGSYYFNYWQDNGDTDRDRSITATDDEITLTAAYSTSPSASPPSDPPEEEEQPPEEITGEISVITVDSSGNQIYGYYTTLSQNGNVIQTAFSPAEFAVDGGQTYQVAVADYGDYAFDHWSDGSTDRFHDAQAGDSLTAVYRP